MKETIEEILHLWGIGKSRVSQIYSSAWEIDHDYVIKVYDDREQLERNIRIMTILWDCGIPVAEILPTKAGEKYIARKGHYFFLSKKLQGARVSDLKDEKIAWEMGRAIAQLHRAFRICETKVEFRDNSLLAEMKGWIRENLAKDGWNTVSRAEYANALERLEQGYDSLPRQLIHRDVHYENFLFYEGRLSGYIDFDLSQRNIRIFDLGYFLAGLLAEELREPFTKEEWSKDVEAAIAGYESVEKLSARERAAIPCVMECIEILFAAYFIGMGDAECARSACGIFHFIQGCESDMDNREPDALDCQVLL